MKITHNPSSNGAKADAAYGTDQYNSNCDHSYVNDSINYDGIIYSVNYGTASDITHWKSITMYGIGTHGTTGNIVDVDVTVRDSECTLHDQVIANYRSDDGDSGAPVFTTSGSTATLLGQHVGKFWEVDVNSGNNLQNVCGSNDYGALVVFSPWDQVASHLGI